MRLFVAVWPSADVVATIAALARPEVEGLRWTTRDQWHITLRFFGAVELEAVSVALRSASAPATTAVLGPETGRFGKRVLHVPVSGLDAVAKAVVRATKKVGKPPEPRPFTGHLTLARLNRLRRHEARDQADQFGLALRLLVGQQPGQRSQLFQVQFAVGFIGRHG